MAAGSVAKEAAKIISNFIKSSRKGSENLGTLKTNLSKKVRENTATKAEATALEKLRASDESATFSQKKKTADAASAKRPISVAKTKATPEGKVTLSPGRTFKSYGGSMKKKTTKKAMGGKIGRGCGAATKGGGAVMK